MYLLMWILGFPTILYHCVFTLLLVSVFLYHKIKRNLFKSSHQCSTTLEPIRKNLLIRMYNRRLNQFKGSGSTSTKCVSSHVMLVLIAIILINASLNGVHSLEEDAILLQPLADVAKSLINAVTTGQPLPVEVRSTAIIKSLIKFSWRTGFPITMPYGFVEKATDFYNRITKRVSETSVENLTRKRLVTLKTDLDLIVDSIVENVRQSPDGLYANHLETKVNGTSLEEACFQVGLQIKAYGIDITNYRNIAGVVLGVPVVPQIASTAVGIGKGINNVHGAAYDAVTSLSGSALNTISSMPFVPNIQQYPMSGYFNQNNAAAAAAPALVPIPIEA